MNDYILEPSDYAPDPDAVSIRIECDRDTAAEAYEAAAALQREARRLSEATVTPSLGTEVKA
jgi:hypothetical protein